MLTINVDEKVIKSGVPCSNCNCPVALAIDIALSEEIGNIVEYVSVTSQSVRAVVKENLHRTTLLPFEASNFIHNFDNSSTKEAVTPFTFILPDFDKWENIK